MENFIQLIQQLPSGRGYGDPLKLLIDLEDGEKIISIHSYKEEDNIILGSKYGNGFIVSHKDAYQVENQGSKYLIYQKVMKQ